MGNSPYFRPEELILKCHILNLIEIQCNPGALFSGIEKNNPKMGGQ
jgi:hypothetical protein